MRFLTCFLARAALATAVATAQAPSPAFEVTSVKPNKSGNGPPFVGMTASGRLVAPNVTAAELIRVAYGVNELQIAGGPGWMKTDRFEVLGAAAAGTPLEQAQAMLKTLLAERFRLAVHIESRAVPQYALTAAAESGSKQFRRSGPECAPPSPPSGWPPPPPPPPPLPDGPRPLMPVFGARCGAISLPGYISARQITIDQLASRLAQAVGRPVINRTGLDGAFDFELAYAPDPLQAGADFVAPRGLPLPWSEAPSIFLAVREQLGLRLEPANEPIEVLAIDRIERPTDN